MATISDLNSAVQAAEDWIDDLMRRLGWQDRERVYLALLATLHALRDCLARDEATISAHSCRRYCAVSITTAGIPARGRRRGAGAGFWSGFMTACTATQAWIRNRSRARYLRCSRRVCQRPRSRMRRPPRQACCTTFGQAEANA